MSRRFSPLTFTHLHQSVSHGVGAPWSATLSLGLLLAAVGFLSFGVLGLVIGVAVAFVLGRYAGRIFGTSTRAPALVPCVVCGSETLSSSGRCPEHR